MEEITPIPTDFLQETIVNPDFYGFSTEFWPAPPQPPPDTTEASDACSVFLPAL